MVYPPLRKQDVGISVLIWKMQSTSFLPIKWREILCVIQLLCLTCVNMQQFAAVQSCPLNKVNWTERSTAKKCQGSTPDYLCASIQDDPSNFGEICTVFGLANPGTCAVLSKSTYNMDFVSCRAASGCPTEHYTPSKLYNYPVCFENFYGETTQSSTMTQSSTTVTSMRPDNGHSDVGIVFAILVSVLILLVIGVVIVFVLYRQNKLPTQMQDRIMAGRRFLLCFRSETGVDQNLQEMNRVEGEMMISMEEHVEHEPEEQKKKIRKLQRYVAHILKEELKVADLQENIILCSSSLREHFNENLMKDLYNVKIEDDYDNLEMTLVFALLINFCTKIKPPVKGWGYEPANDDISVGADMERIRSMWNEYCDNDHQYPQLQGVYSRMVERYGEIPERISNEDERFEDVRTKYQVLMLKKDCPVDDGVVVTESIKSALQLLETSDIVICRGAIGCGKSTAMRYIQEQFLGKRWKTLWVEEYVNDSDLNEEDIENTLLCCDNLFGTFSCNVFPSDCENLFGMLKCHVHSSESPLTFQGIVEKKRKIYGKHLKIVLGIHNHVYDMVIKEYAVELFQNKRWIIDMDKYTQAELLLIWKEEQKIGHCVLYPDCWFKKLNFASVSAKLSLSRGLVGNPLLLLMYCHQHNFFSNDEFTKSPVSTLVDHFKTMKKENPELFYALAYVMCVTIHNKDQGVEDGAGLIHANLTTDNFRSVVEKNPEYFYEEEKTIELKHELLNITLFKASIEIQEVRSSLVQVCGTLIIFQLAKTKEEYENEFMSRFSLFNDKEKEKICKRIAEASGQQLKDPQFLRMIKRATRKIGKSQKES